MDICLIRVVLSHDVVNDLVYVDAIGLAVCDNVVETSIDTAVIAIVSCSRMAMI